MAFKRNLENEKQRLENESFMHLVDVLSDEFVASLRKCGEDIRRNKMPEVEAWHIPGKKRQYLFDFPSTDFLKEFCKGIGQITGYDPEKITVGERHIKVYLEEAPEYPAPHMDRKAAEFTIGFPIHISEGSRVCFFPHLSREENCGQRAIYADVPPSTNMKEYYNDERIHQFEGKIGDMFIFHGSTIFHERIRSAGSMILYIKINASGQDPLGEHASMLERFKTAKQKPGFAEAV
ncbi:MAG: hypothetical protein AAGA76_05350 [Pseudomonadota bacterium]